MHMRGSAGRGIVAQVKYRVYAILPGGRHRFSLAAGCKAP